MEKQYYVYIMANAGDRVLYVGVTSDLLKRVYQHRNKLIPGFTSRYNVKKLVYFEVTKDVLSAIAREKQIKGGSREDKMQLINEANHDWKDLHETIAY